MENCGDNIVRQIYLFIEPIYSCTLNKEKDYAASLACVSNYYNLIRHKANPEIYKDKCKIIKTMKTICITHCKASPIMILIHNISHSHSRNTGSEYMHFPSKHVAKLALRLLPHIHFYKACCGGKGLAYNKKNIKNVWLKIQL